MAFAHSHRELIIKETLSIQGQQPQINVECFPTTVFFLKTEIIMLQVFD